MASQAEKETPGGTRFRNSLACVPCRSRHVKCDNNRPGCTRCQMDGKNCYFMKSRRGMNRGKVPTANGQDFPSLRRGQDFRSSTIPSTSPQLSTLNTSLIDPFMISPTESSDSIAQSLTPASSVRSPSYHSSQVPKILSNTVDTAQCKLEKHLDLYYDCFHNAHPWVLPRRPLNRLIHSSRDQMERLLTVMAFIGSTYTTKGQSIYLREKALTEMAAPDLPRTPFSVQALLILSIGTHCCSDFQLARDTLDRAINIALELGMHCRNFAAANGNRDPVLEESWRRTWWGVYVTDASIEAIARTLNPRTNFANADVDLPCEEIDYRHETIPTPRTLAEYMERDLAEIEVSYSSFAYLIDIARILGETMIAVLREGDVSDAIITEADAALTNWTFHLPEEKKDILKANGEIDEPMFHAHMDCSVTQVWIHRTRSTLIHSPIESTAKCAPPVPSCIPQSKRQAFWLSTKKTLNAATQAIDIFTLQMSLAHHTPMVICGVVLAVLAQLSACSYVLQDAEYEAARNRIRLGIGTLKEFGKTWPVGNQSLIEVKGIAREVFAIAEAKKNWTPEAQQISESKVIENLNGTAIHPMDIQSIFDEFGALDYLSMLDVPAVWK